jgi:parallel beta-helix repeat protein
VYENFWNTTLSPGPNIVGGPNIGGNFYANPSGNGFSETPSTCSDINPRDGICDSSYTLTTDNIDYLPLAAPPPALGCGILDQPNKIYALTQDISSNGTCFTVAADNVTLDCQGHTINYAQNSAGYGVYVNGHNYVNIKNCKLQQTNNTVTWAHGVYLNSSSYNDITNVVITTTGIYSLGIFMSSSSYNTLSNNIITISSSHGILLYVNSNYNTIYNNNITSINSNGVYLWNSSFNSFYNNLINGTTPVYFNGIIYQNFWNTTKNCSAGPNIVGGQCIGGNFYATPSGNGFSETPSTCSDINPRDGICDSSYTLTTDNIDYLPLAAPPPALGCGILDQPNKIYALTQDISSNGTCFTVAADNVTLDCQGHTITYAINQSGNGIRISGKNHTTVKNCIIIQTNNTVQQAQAFMLDSSNHNQLINNTITTNGSSYSNGINIQSYSTNNTITENRITTFNLQSRGIMFDSYSNKNTISNNNITITASGSSLQNAPFGIVLRTVDNNTITGNRITTTGTYGDGVIILSGNGNNFTDNIISTSGANADALYLFKFESNVENNIFVNNILRAINGFDFISVGASNNTIINMTFNGSSYPTTASFVYDGNISIDSANAIQSPGFFNVSKYLNITNQSSGAWVFLNISYDQPSFDESKLRMYKWDTTSSSWQLLPDPNGVDTVNNIVYANITSFSTFAPLAQLGITPPTITIISPQNVTYNTSIVDFNVSLNEPGSWCGYSLNGEPNVTMTQINSSYFSAVRADLATGQYSIRFSCNDTAGNMNSTGLMYFSTNVTYNATVLNISIPKWSTLDAIMLNITSPVNVSVDVMYDGTIDWRTGQTTGINVDTSSWLANCQPYIWTSEGPECLLPIAIYGDNVASANITINYWYTNIPWAWQGAEMRISRAGKLMFDFSEIPTGIAKRARSVSLYHASRIPLAYGDFVTVYGVDAAGNRISTTIIIPFPPKEEKIITLPEASVSFVINPNCAGTRGEVRATTSADVAVYHEGTLLMVQSVGTAGFFAFTPELPGMYTFVASKEGYQDKTITYKVNDCSATRSTSMFGNILKCDAGVCKLISSITSTYMEGVTVDLSQFKQIISGISKVVDALNTMWKSFTYDSQNGILNISVTRPDFTVEADTGVSTVVETTSVNATIKINTPADVRIPATKIAVPGIEKKAIKRVAYISDGVEKNITDFSIEPGYIVINEELDIKKT